MADSVCYYAGEEYSSGSIIEVDGEYQECYDDDGTMYWGEPGQVIPDKRSRGDGPEPYRPAETGTTAVARASGSCSYAGKKYSVGAKLKMPNGEMKQCTNRPGNKTGWFPA
jgi:hypothetical protein